MYCAPVMFRASMSSMFAWSACTFGFKVSRRRTGRQENEGNPYGDSRGEAARSLVEELHAGDPRFKKAAVAQVNAVERLISLFFTSCLTEGPEAVAERPGDVDEGRDLLNIAGEARGLFRPPAVTGHPRINETAMTGGTMRKRLRSG